MANVINTNISSLSAQRNLSTSQSSLATSLQRLSTGLRINSAKDDAAGQAISTRMTAQINGMQQASRNANDGVSMSQTAEGAMGSVNDVLLRMRDLSVQASNGTNGTSERAAIQNEVDQLYQEIDRISGSTEFNGIKLLTGAAKNNTFQIGANAGQSISFDIKEVSTKSMKLSGSAAESADMSGGRMGAVNTLTNASLSINGTAIAFETDTARSAGEVAAAINKQTSATGVTASATNVVKGTENATGVASGLTIQVQNADGTAGTAVTISNSKNMDELVANINRQVGGITAAIDDKGALTLSNDTGASITIGGTVTNTGLTTGANSGYLNLTGQDGAKITLGGDDLAKFGFNSSVGAGNISGTQVASGIAASGTAAAATTALNGSAGGNKLDTVTDKVKINGVELNQDAFKTAFTAGEKAQAINALTAQTGVKATATTNAFVDVSGQAVAANGELVVNGVEYGASADNAALVTSINAKFATGDSNGISATLDTKTGKVQLTSATGQDINVSVSATGTPASAVGIRVGTSADSSGVALAGAAGSAVAVRGEIKLESESGGAIKLESAAAAGLAKLGLVAQGGSADPILGGKLDVSTAKGAQDAIGRIDKALAFVSEQRSNMGAVQNRLNTTISNLATATENASAARSRIQDTDFATETANLTRGQILQQAGTAMLAQANSLPNGVLSLLRG
jgi:flagellin